MKGDEQICWSCNKTCSGECCWFAENKPVPNWVATETKIKITSEDNKKRYYVSSYKVQKCPLYKCDNPAEELPTKVIADFIGVSRQVVASWKVKGKLQEYLKQNKRIRKKLENYYVE